MSARESERIQRQRIGGTVRARREARGWSQAWLAAQIGRTQAWLSRIESGKRWFSHASEMAALFALLDVPLPWESEARLREVEAERDALTEKLDTRLLTHTADEWLSHRFNEVWDEKEAAEAEVERLREELLIAGGDFLRIKGAVGRGNYGLASSIAYDAWYRTAIAAPGAPSDAAFASPPSVEPKETGE